MPSPGVQRGALAIAAMAGACARDPLPATCPDVAVGDLVLSELRGPQSNDEDPYGEWIEVYNASGGDLDLAGVRVDVRKLDGSGVGGFLVRSHDVAVAAGGFAVLGRFDDGVAPGHVDYGYRADFDDALYGSAGVDLVACGVVVDRVIYRGLTDFGTLGLDGAIDPPSATANDDELAFCVDDVLDENDPSAGVRGTPGEPNRACP